MASSRAKNDWILSIDADERVTTELAKEINDLRKEVPQFKNFMKLSGKNIYSLFLAKRLLSKEIKGTEFSYTIL